MKNKEQLKNLLINLSKKYTATVGGLVTFDLIDNTVIQIRFPSGLFKKINIAVLNNEQQITRKIENEIAGLK